MYQKTTRMKRITSTALSFAMLIACIQMPVRAEVPDQYLSEVEIGEDILQNNVFYIPTVSASINETTVRPIFSKLPEAATAQRRLRSSLR